MLNDKEAGQEIFLQAQDTDLRLDKWLAAQLPDMSRSAIQNLISNGMVTLEGKALSKSTKLVFGKEIRVWIPEPESLDVAAEKIPLDILYEDADLLVVNKPKGMVVHPAPGNYTGTLVNALLDHCGESLSGINGTLRPGIVHRIDKDTSGLLLVAKNEIGRASCRERV